MQASDRPISDPQKYLYELSNLVKDVSALREGDKKFQNPADQSSVVSAADAREGVEARNSTEQSLTSRIDDYILIHRAALLSNRNENVRQNLQILESFCEAKDDVRAQRAVLNIKTIIATSSKFSGSSDNMSRGSSSAEKVGFTSRGPSSERMGSPSRGPSSERLGSISRGGSSDSRSSSSERFGSREISEERLNSAARSTPSRAARAARPTQLTSTNIQEQIRSGATSIDLTGVNYTNADLLTLGEDLKNSSVTHVVLNKEPAAAAGFMAQSAHVGTDKILEVLSSCPTLESVDLSHNNKLTGKSFSFFKDKPLRTLNLSYCTGISIDGMRNILNMTSLENLNLAGCIHIAKALLDFGQFSRLKSLDVSGTTFDETNLASLSSTSVEILNLKNSSITTLPKTIVLDKLSEIDLSGIPELSEDEGVQFVSRQPSLRKVNLNGEAFIIPRNLQF